MLKKHILPKRKSIHVIFRNFLFEKKRHICISIDVAFYNLVTKIYRNKEWQYISVTLKRNFQLLVQLETYNEALIILSMLLLCTYSLDK